MLSCITYFQVEVVYLNLAIAAFLIEFFDLWNSLDNPVFFIIKILKGVKNGRSNGQV